MKKIDKVWLDTHQWMLRSSKHGRSYRGFQWKRKGAWTKPDKWRPVGCCGNGLHGETPWHHGFDFLYSNIELCETRGEVIPIPCLCFSDKVKVPEARIVARGVEIPEEAFTRCGYALRKHTSGAITVTGKNRHTLNPICP